MGPSWDSDRGDRPEFPLARRLIAVSLALVLLAPAAAAIDKGGKENPRKYAAECEREDWIGLQDQLRWELYQACARYDVDVPTGTGSSGDLVRTSERTECPEDFDGFVLERNNTDEDTEVGACILVDYAVPDPLRSYPSYDTDLESCEIPDSQRNGTDPVIELWDGYVLFCVVPILDPGEPDKPFEVSTEPCEPGTTDPEIRIGNGRVEVCLAFHVLGGSPDIPERTV